MTWWDADTSAASKHLSLMRLQKPIIAAVNGWCLGGGMWYALCADITIASNRAAFGQPEVRENQNSTFLLAAEPVKRIETLCYDAFCVPSFGGGGSLIQAMLGSFGSFGGCGRRWRKRAGLAA